MTNLTTLKAELRENTEKAVEKQRRQEEIKINLIIEKIANKMILASKEGEYFITFNILEFGKEEYTIKAIEELEFYNFKVNIEDYEVYIAW